MITYEKPDDLKNTTKIEYLRQKVQKAGIVWCPLQYHKRPTSIATAFDATLGVLWGIYLIHKYDIQIVHCRSYVSSLVGYILKKICKVKFVFDMRGFWADEKKDTKQWSENSILYKLTKYFEKKFLKSADHVISLTEAAVKEIFRWNYASELKRVKFSVIPTCANLQLFHPIARSQTNSFIVGYVGGASHWYDFNSAVKFFKLVIKSVPTARLLILNKSEHAFIEGVLQQEGIQTSQYELRAVEHEQISQYIGQMSVAVFFIRPTFSKIASAPTKLAEVLACGVPCVTGADIGDTDEIIKTNHVGVIVKPVDDANLHKAYSEFVNLKSDVELSARCRKTAEKYFSLDNGASEYNRIYDQLLIH